MTSKGRNLYTKVQKPDTIHCDSLIKSQYIVIAMGGH